MKRRRTPGSSSFYIALSVIATALSCGCQIPSTASLDLNDMSKAEVEANFGSIDFLHYRDYSFFTHDENNVLVRYDENDRVCEFSEIVPSTLNENNIHSIAVNDDMRTVVSKIGLPSFEGMQNQFSLDFAKSENLMCRITFREEDDEWKVDDKWTLNKDDPASWFDACKADLPDPSDAEIIAVGMSLDDVVSILGKPQRDTGSGPLIMEFDLSDGRKLDITFLNNSDQENAYQNAESRIYGTHYLYVTSIRWMECL